VFEHACRLGLEGIVSKHKDSQRRGPIQAVNGEVTCMGGEEFR
jgi:hypothetical protein